ncbi:uncharacterized membrane protein YoaK (UPF0700 family) [Paraburkholderia sp. GAS199]|uniref:hypothetical protein n=1 Tax=Paraburkholderia sp. GAS199 TaxID=3035126 RepID=UPI003D24AF42
MKKLLAPALTFVLLISIGRYTGLNFLQRGGDQALWITEAILAGLALFVFLCATEASVRVGVSRSARPVWSLVATLLVLFLGWYCGVDYSVEGSHQACALACALGTGCTIWMCPLWKPVDDRF